MADTHSITQRIDQLWRQKNFATRGALGEKLVEKGIKLSAFHRWFNTRTPPSTALIVAIGELFKDVSMDWLLLGRGEMLIHSPDSLIPMKKKSPLLHYLELEARVSLRVEGLEQQIVMLKDEFVQMKNLINENTTENEPEAQNKRISDAA